MAKGTYRAACAGCGKQIFRGAESRPPGVARCMPCRRVENAPRLVHGSSGQRQILKAHTYQARKRGAFVEQVNPLEIYKRDRWRCHICKRRLSPNTKWPHPRRPSLDHDRLRDPTARCREK
jgi:hypothetical protein